MDSQKLQSKKHPETRRALPSRTAVRKEAAHLNAHAPRHLIQKPGSGAHPSSKNTGNGNRSQRRDRRQSRQHLQTFGQAGCQAAHGQSPQQIAKPAQRHLPPANSQTCPTSPAPTTGRLAKPATANHWGFPLNSTESADHWRSPLNSSAQAADCFLFLISPFLYFLQFRYKYPCSFCSITSSNSTEADATTPPKLKSSIPLEVESTLRVRRIRRQAYEISPINFPSTPCRILLRIVSASPPCPSPPDTRIHLCQTSFIRAPRPLRFPTFPSSSYCSLPLS